MYREAPIKNGMFDYQEFTRILKHGAKEKDEAWKMGVVWELAQYLITGDFSIQNLYLNWMPTGVVHKVGQIFLPFSTLPPPW